MFRKLHPIEAPVTVFIDSVACQAEAHETLAAVLCRQSALWSRKTAVSGAKRAPFCMMGTCFECLATVDGVPSVQTCLVPVKDGMCVERQIGATEVPL